MKMIAQIRRKAVFLFPLLLFCCFTLALASTSFDKSRKHASTNELNGVITLRLVLSNNREVLVSQYAGEMLTVGPKDGNKLGITPRISDTGAVAVEFAQVTKTVKDGVLAGGSTTGIGRLELSSSGPQITSLNQISSIELIGIAKGVDTAGVRLQSIQGCPCCVTCDGEECCGLSVQMSCGRCSC
jgi:hypothetical protein